ncbi:MAG: hypothetical protein VYB54_12780 [Pseudomonadota bacterium]|nr:hypothetical protein [Pseudomonadota bacterium]
MRIVVLFTVALGLLLGACGKKGDPLTPSEAAARQAEQQAKTTPQKQN